MGEELLTGWGRSTWSQARVERPRSAAEVASELVRTPDVSVIARGLGRSYGDQAANAGGTVFDMTRQIGSPPRFEPDAEGLISLPAGTSIDDLLAHVVPQGWFVPVTPGTRHVTIGGAIAADIHGKNHHADGSFCAHLRSVTLVLADGTQVTVGPHDDPDLFWATAGGMGLTGVIVAAEVQLKRISSSRVLVDTSRLTQLDDLLPAMLAADRTAPYSVAWIDLANERTRGRSVLTTARFADASELPAKLAAHPLAYRADQRVSAPPWVPNGLLRPMSVRAFNEVWFRAAPKSRTDEVQSIARYFHPLDGVKDWNRIYGSQGFLQWQMVVPDGAEAVLGSCVSALSSSPAPSFLAVLKRFGAANPGPLSFPLQGWTLAADMPALSPGLAELLDALDREVADAGGRIYLAKDARLDPELLPEMYPRLDEWRAVRDRVDPQHRFQSDMARRLGI